MTKAKYNPPSPRTLGVRLFINKYWQPRPENIRRYGFKDFEWFVSQGLNNADISRAFGFKSSAPATDMVALFKLQGAETPRA